MKKPIFVLDDGTETTIMSEYIRQEFKKDKSRSEIRKDISRKLGREISINTVYTATANMYNARTKPRKTAYVEFDDGTKVQRNKYIKEQVIDNQRKIKEVAEKLGVDYNTVYHVVKDFKGKPVIKRGKNRKVEVEGKQVVWRDFIINQWRKGRKVNDIAQKLGEPYEAIYHVLYQEKKKGV